MMVVSDRNASEGTMDFGRRTATANDERRRLRLAHLLFSSLLYFRFLRLPQICKFGVWNWFPRVCYLLKYFFQSLGDCEMVVHILSWESLFWRLPVCSNWFSSRVCV